MARGINKVILVGNLGQDPETRAMPSGKAVTNVRVATSDSWKDKQTGEQKEQTEWHTVVFFDRLAEIGRRELMDNGCRARRYESAARLGLRLVPVDDEGEGVDRPLLLARLATIVSLHPGDHLVACHLAVADWVEGD